MFQGQIGEIPFLSQKKLGFFLILALFFYLPLPKTGHSHPVKNYFFTYIYNTGLSCQKVLSWCTKNYGFYDKQL